MMDTKKTNSTITKTAELEKTNHLLSEQKRLLELITTGMPLDECLSALCEAIPRLNPGVRASVLIADEPGKKFNRPVAPNLLPSFSEGLEGAPINDLAIGTCGTAVYSGQSISCTDIQNDKKWSEDWRNLCIRHNILACHSTPVFDGECEPIGSFMLCFNEARKPNSWELRLAEFGTHIASIAFERDRSNLELRETREQLEMATRAGAVGTWTWNIKENIVIADEYLAEAYDMDTETAAAGASMESFYEPIHEEDEKKTWNKLMEAVEQTGELETEYRVQNEKDETLWILARGKVEYDNGEPVQMRGTISDITDYKRRQNELREREEHLSGIVNTTPECIKIVAEDGTLLQMNAAGLKMIEAESESDVVGKSVYNLIDPEHLEAFKEFHKRICEGENGIFEFDIIGLKGARCHMESHATHLQQPDGTVSHLALTRDISQHKRNEEKLRESKERLNAVLEGSEVGAWDLNLEDETAWRSPRHDQIFGYDSLLPEWTYEKFMEHVIPEDREVVGKKFNKALANDGVWDFECRILQKNGRKRWIWVRGKIAYTNGIESSKRMLGTIQDITKRKRRENALRESEGRLDLAAELSHLGIWRYDPKTDLVHVDERMRKIWGEPEDAEKIALPEVIERIHPDDRERVSGAIGLALDAEHENDFYNIDYRIVRDDGTVRWITANGLARFDSENKDKEREALEFFGTAVDITERKRQSEELEEMNETLEERVEERTSALVSYQKQLRNLANQLSKTEENERRRLATELHDNLGQMLAVCKMKIDFLKRKKTADVSDISDELEKALAYTRKLVTDLKPPPRLGKEDISKTLEWLADKMKEYGLTVHFKPAESHEPLDEEIQTILAQCVRELLFNVVKHANANEARITLGYPNERIKITVEDEGDGFNANNNEARLSKGMGFGLFNIQERVEMSGGRVDVSSQPGRGTQVSLSVPLGGEKADTEPSRNQKAKKDKVKHDGELTKILLIDDHAMMRDGLRSIIEEESDLTVIAEAADGEQGVKLASEKKPDVVLMDINLPGMNGIDATKKIKEQLPDTRVIGLSLHDEKKVAREIMSVGASAYLNKSDAFETLCATIRSETEK